MKRAPRKVVSHETYSLSLIFLPIFLHLRHYPPTCMKIGRAAPPQTRQSCACLCRLLAALLSRFFPHASQNRPYSSAGEPSFRCFPCSPPLAGAQSRSGRTPKRSFLPQHTPLRPPESLALLEREPTPTVLLRRSDFGEFCIVSHETSAFSMFSTCLILLCLCPSLVAFLRDLERKTRFLPTFPSHDRSPTVVFARRRGRKPRQAGATLAPQQTDAQPRKTGKKTRGAGEGMGSSPRAAVRQKSRHGRRPPVWMQNEDERWFLCAAVHWRYAGRRGGGERG